MAVASTWERGQSPSRELGTLRTAGWNGTCRPQFGHNWNPSVINISNWNPSVIKIINISKTSLQTPSEILWRNWNYLIKPSSRCPGWLNHIWPQKLSRLSCGQYVNVRPPRESGIAHGDRQWPTTSKCSLPEIGCDSIFYHSTTFIGKNIHLYCFCFQFWFTVTLQNPNSVTFPFSLIARFFETLGFNPALCMPRTGFRGSDGQEGQGWLPPPLLLDPPPNRLFFTLPQIVNKKCVNLKFSFTAWTWKSTYAFYSHFTHLGIHHSRGVK